MIVKIDPEIIVYSRKFPGLCRKPYHGHPKGCPNFGKEGCPPGLSLIDKVLDFSKDVYVIYTEFNVGEFAESIRLKHPEWKSPRMWYNPRYWQPRARKYHRMEENKALELVDYIEKCPEGRGVNITDLMSKVGVELNWDWPPEHNLENKTYLVSLAGTKLE